MAYVPGYCYDLFFSYATVDNQPLPAMPGVEGFRWVSEFRRCLRVAVDKQLGRTGLVADFFDEKSVDALSVLSSELDSAVRQSALFIAVNSEGFLNPACACNLERLCFLDSLGKTAEERSAQRRVVIAHIAPPVAREKWQQAFFPNVRGAEFYYFEPNTDQARPLLPLGNDYQKYVNAIDKLARVIAVRLGEMRDSIPAGTPPVPGAGVCAVPAVSPSVPSAQPAAAPPSVAERGNIFLAMTFGDLSGERRRLEALLEGAGYNVLPSYDRDYSATNYSEEAKADIENSVAFVQLLSPEPWRPGGYDIIQYQAAATTGKPLFRWRSPDVELESIENPAQKALLSAKDITASGLDDFRKMLLEKLAQLMVPKRADSGNARVVYYAVQKEDRNTLGQHVQQALSSRGILYEEQDFTEPFAPRFESEPCQGFMLLCNSDGPRPVPGIEDPLRDRISECRRIQLSLKDLERMPAVGVLYWPPPDEMHLRSSALKLYKIRSDQNAEFDRFLSDVWKVSP